MRRNMSGDLAGVIDDMLTGSVAGNIQVNTEGGGSDVTITPTLTEGTKIADFTIDDTEGSLYAPTPESPIQYTAGANIQISEENVISATDTTYTAGANVQISEENVISATDTTYTAGNNITIENGVISANTSGGSSINYSTTEQEVGTWIDGSKIYRRTWSFDNVVEIQANTWGDTNILVSNTNINLIIDVKSISSNGFNQCVGATTDGGTLTNVRLLNYRNNVIQVKYLTLDYTKIS